ncbi:hypothetical protein [Streptomyces gilvosporeus]|uniref:Uncharacterized protein n=1 Tax=Streptomyces gilvosporeus TaxID=553510 RepID=A0A1V0TTQ3_9ACTN|nr:hypothetical protein [Streptomyces gilvosporeus]ARF56345.1 hypothetical protein B1H19_21125 [Streptomyces gilvosporeus]
MTEKSAVLLALVFGVITVLLVRSRDCKWWEATLIGLFGMYVGQTPLLFAADGLVRWFISVVTRT